MNQKKTKNDNSDISLAAVFLGALLFIAAVFGAQAGWKFAASIFG